jgi:hypothetical protein
MAAKKDKIVWEEPKSGKFGPEPWLEKVLPLDQLRANQGRWAVLRTYNDGQTSAASSTVSHWKKRFPGFEFCSRSLPDEGVKLYGRYVGENGDAAS